MSKPIAGDFASDKEMQQYDQALDATCALIGCERRATNLIAVSEYIALDNPEASARTVAAIVKAVENLKRFPAAGRPGRVPGTRELVVSGTPYIVPYRVRGNLVE